MLALPITPMAAHLLQPADYAVLDLETGDAPPAEVDSAISAWKPPKHWKPETVEVKRAERAETLNGKAALLDASPILCVALKTERMAVVLNGMEVSSPEIPGWLCLPCGDEKGLLVALRSVLEGVANPDTILVGHNLLGFDLPKLRNAYLRHRLFLPAVLRPLDGAGRQPVFDSMREIRAFSMENSEERFISLETVARVLGIPQPKQVISGAEVPRLHREGEYAAILAYCALDVATTERAFLLMTGEAADLE